ncbi:MAG: anti-sigma factor family protein [Catenulispora sp.]
MMIDPAASGPDTHLDPDRMADLYDGLLDHDAAEAARLHLASCPRCADDFALIAVDSGLSDLLAPEPIPEAVAIRVEAALHREPPLAAPSSAPQHAASDLTRRTRRFRLISSLAGATLVIAGAFAGISALTSGGSSSGTSDKGASSYAADRGNSPAGRVPAAGSAIGPNRLDSSEPAPLAPNDSAASIRAQAEQLLKTSALGNPAQSGPQSAAGSPEKAQGERITCPPDGFQNTSPLGMASITYQGRPAELLVYAKPGDDATAAVYVVAAAGCTAQGPGTVLYSTEVPRR